MVVVVVNERLGLIKSIMHLESHMHVTSGGTKKGNIEKKKRAVEPKQDVEL